MVELAILTAVTLLLLEYRRHTEGTSSLGMIQERLWAHNYYCSCFVMLEIPLDSIHVNVNITDSRDTDVIIFAWVK